MLGRLATWLRIMGYDTVYSKKTDQRGIILQAQAQNRILLTRNTRLLLFRSIINCEYLFIEHDHFRDQLLQIVTEYDLKCEIIGKICVRCNRFLEETSKASIERIIPAYVAYKHNHFLRCAECGRVYWPATHKTSIIEEITEVFKRAGKTFDFPG